MTLPEPWSRIDAVGPTALVVLRELVDGGPLPAGAAIFDLRSEGRRTLFFTPSAGPVADAMGVPGRRSPCGPPTDDPRLRLFGGDPGAWLDVVRPIVGAAPALHECA